MASCEFKVNLSMVYLISNFEVSRPAGFSTNLVAADALVPGLKSLNRIGIKHKF